MAGTKRKMNRKIQRHTANPALPANTPNAQIPLWRLPKPKDAFFADACAYRVAEGVPTLLFYQFGPRPPAISSVLAIAMSPPRLAELVKSFDSVLARLEHHNRGWDTPASTVAVDDLDVSASQYRKSFATFARGGCNDDVATMDFFAVDFVAPDQQPGVKVEDLVHGVASVLMPPFLLGDLFAKIQSRHGAEA